MLIYKSNCQQSAIFNLSMYNNRCFYQKCEQRTTVSLTFIAYLSLGILFEMEIVILGAQ